MKRNQAITKGFVFGISLCIALLLCEMGSRLVLNPADYLSADMVSDNVLGITIVPGSPGFDEWGFRNKQVPKMADVVTIGDSHTYGNTATMDDAWPAVVARETGLAVYNLGLGGYGPNQYYHLLTTKGLKLHPKWVLCGLYMGDDFENSFSITYGLDCWSSLRNERYENVDPNIWDLDQPVWGAKIRDWLSKHSMTYRLVIHSPLLAVVNEAVRFKLASQGEDPYTTVLTVKDRNIQEAFRPVGIAERLDQSNSKVREGMRITFQLLEEMNNACKKGGCQFLVVIIPTKESVFSEYLENNSGLHLHATIRRLLASESLARKALLEFLGDAGIAHIDTLPALKDSVSDALYAKTTRDMHPGKNGYKVIGEAVAGYLAEHR